MIANTAAVVDFAPYLTRIGQQRPRIHCLTNAVVQNMTANYILAIGAIPSMTANPVEIADFIRSAQGVLVNLGTLDPERQSAITTALTTAQQMQIPWILDPVLIDRSAHRLTYARDLCAHTPAVIRGNYTEIDLLKTDGIFPVDEEIIWVRTGKIDHIAYQGHDFQNKSGHALMDRITGMGCAGTAILTAFLAVTPPADYIHATRAAMAFLGHVGALAGQVSQAPASFEILFHDQLYIQSQIYQHEG